MSIAVRLCSGAYGVLINHPESLQSHLIRDKDAVNENPQTRLDEDRSRIKGDLENVARLKVQISKTLRRISCP